MAHFRTVPDFGRAKGFCTRGGRQWFARHQLDWLDFVRNGIDDTTLLASGDALAFALVRHAHAQEQHDGR